LFSHGLDFADALHLSSTPPGGNVFVLPEAGTQRETGRRSRRKLTVTGFQFVG
jgi:hypothetical protein